MSSYHRHTDKAHTPRRCPGCRVQRFVRRLLSQTPVSPVNTSLHAGFCSDRQYNPAYRKFWPQQKNVLSPISACQLLQFILKCLLRLDITCIKQFSHVQPNRFRTIFICVLMTPNVKAKVSATPKLNLYRVRPAIPLIVQMIRTVSIVNLFFTTTS